MVLAFLRAATEGGFIAASGVISAILVAVTVPIWRARAGNRITPYGSARWAEQKEIRRAGQLKPDGVLYGRWRAFWSSVALMSGRYQGQPMAAHLPLPIDTPYFDRWLEIFAETGRDICPPSAAAHFIERAHRIADSLELGIAVRKGEIRPKRARPASTLPPAGNADGARSAGRRPSARQNRPSLHGSAPP